MVLYVDGLELDDFLCEFLNTVKAPVRKRIFSFFVVCFLNIHFHMLIVRQIEFLMTTLNFLYKCSENKFLG